MSHRSTRGCLLGLLTWAAVFTLARAEKAGIRPEFQVSESSGYRSNGYVYPHNEGKGSVDIAASASGTFVAAADGTFVVAWSHYDYYSGTTRVVGRQLGDPPVPCTPVPQAGCREQALPRRGVFRFQKGSSAHRNALTWRWVRGEAVSPDALGDPLETDSYAFCVYDASANPQPLISAAVPAGGGCGKLPCWKHLGGSRIDYFDSERFVGGVERIRITASGDGSARMQVWARRENLTLPNPPLTPPVLVQLQAANGTCWTATYGAFISANADGVSKAKPGS